MQTPGVEISLRVSVADQALEVVDAAGEIIRRYPVSTSRFGLGTEPGSLRTPLGMFRVGDKFGDGAPLGSIFESRLPTGGSGLGVADGDLVLTRILWLEGTEDANANTRERYIYIHGTNQERLIGEPASHGCVRMRNVDVAELYDLVPTGSTVRIEET